MKNLSRIDFAFLVFVLLASFLYFTKLPLVPFHPDESTQIFMSGDIDLLLESPDQLPWSATPEDPLRQKYRALDAPITRTMIGLGRFLFNISGLQNDWNWSKSWSENRSNGALPDERTLTASRIFVSFLFPFSLVFLYLIGKEISNPLTGWLAAVLFFANPHILLHTRRAMAESMLVFFVILFIYMLLKVKNKGWWLAIPASLAFNAKQSAIGLTLVSITYMLTHKRALQIKKTLVSLILFGSIFLAVEFLLNPFLWAHPIQAVDYAIESRQELVEAQTGSFAPLNPDMVLDDLHKKALALFAQVYFGPPQYVETGNYLAELSAQIQQYQDDWLFRLLSGQVFHFIILFLTIAGIVRSTVLIFQNKEQAEHHFYLTLTFFITFLSILFLIPLSFQRYYLPIIPMLCIYAAFAIFEIGDLIRTSVNKSRN